MNVNLCTYDQSVLCYFLSFFAKPFHALPCDDPKIPLSLLALISVTTLPNPNVIQRRILRSLLKNEIFMMCRHMN